MIAEMEILMSPDIGRRQWGITKERNRDGVDVWYVAPKPQVYGFATALSEAVAHWQHEITNISVSSAARAIIWC